MAKSTVTNEENTFERLVTIVIPSSDDNDGDVYVSLNGKTYQIQRDIEVKVPIGVAEVIKESTQMKREGIKRRKALQI